MNHAQTSKIDAHHHLWDAERYPYPWLASSATRIPLRYLVEDFLADTARQGVVKSVHVQGEIARHLSLFETDWLQQIADAHGFPHAIVAYAALESEDVEAMLDAHAAHPNVRGIRQILNPDQCERDDLLTDSAWRSGYARLGQHALSFDLQAAPHQMADAAEVAQLYPGTAMIVNHTGLPRDRAPEGQLAWRQGMQRLAELPNTSVKISGFSMWGPNWTVESIRPLVLETVDIFGVDRCMFASNFPVDRPYTTYDRLFDAFSAITRGFSGPEREALFRSNAERIYRIG
ncbi:MAG TPA: amidohydrolase family protein [Chloroflexota bacterium]